MTKQVGSNKSLKSTRFLDKIALFLFAIIFLPIVFLLVSSFSQKTDTLVYLFENLLIDYSINTIYLIAITSFFSLLIGIIPAWYVSNYKFKGRNLIDLILYLPLAIPTYIMAFTYSEILSFTGPFKITYDFLQIEFLGIILAFSLYPYIYSVSRISFSLFGSRYYDIAKNLGLNSYHTLLKVVLPLSKPAIFSGLFLVIMEVLNEYGAVKYFGVNTYTIGIFRSWNSMNDTGAAIQLSSILLFIVAFLFLSEKIFNKNKRFSFSKNSNLLSLNKPSKLRLLFIYTVCVIPIFLAFIIPVVFNLINIISNIESIDFARLFTLTFNSFSVSLIASVLILVFSTFFLYNEKISKSKIYYFINQFISLGYSIPGAVVALSVTLFITSLDNLNDEVRIMGSFSVYFLILVYAYVIRFMAVGKSPIQSSLEKHPESYDNSAKNLGLSNYQIFKKVYFPINKYSFFTALTLVFIDLMKELPITLILRPFNFDTLATQTYEFAVEEMIPLSSIYSSVIILICSILLILLKIFLDKSDVFRS